MFNIIKKYNRGFTLVELIVSIAIIGIISIAIADFQTNVFKYNKYAKDVLESSQDAKIILKTIVKELRSTSQSSNGAYPLTSVGTSTITFYSDIDSDGVVEQVRYFLASTTLKKGVVVPSGSPLVYNQGNESISYLAYNIKNSTSTALFEYYDNTYAGTSSPLSYPINSIAIRLVRINLLIDADPNRSPIPRLYTSTVTLRNLKDNL